MDYRSFVSLSLKLVGVLVLVFAFNDLPYLINLWSLFQKTAEQQVNPTYSFLGVLFVLVFRFFIGFVLIYFSQAVANKMIVSDAEVNLTDSRWIYILEVVAFRSIGVFCFVAGMSDFVFVYWRYKTLGMNPFAGYEGAPLYEFGGAIAYIVLGLSLVLGGKGFAYLLQKIRS